MLESVELKKRENNDDLDFLQMNGYVPCGIISIWVYFFYQKQVPVSGTLKWNMFQIHLKEMHHRHLFLVKKIYLDTIR
jgi:hypothetical protein